MAGARTTRVQRLTSAVLAILIALPVLQITTAGMARTGPKPRTNLTTSCVGCCGSNCQCSGDCCGDTHVETTTDSPPQWSAAEYVSRDRDCQKGGWLLPTVTTKFQPWSDTARSHQPTPALRLFRNPTAVVCRWQRPAVSQLKPRAPPLVGPSPIVRFIG
jgi:hypothetical protein